ncbi:PBS lyase HEAT-like repeat family protein [uncultured delta proteobacterium]|uniref:PBS lyase HEAT-like repeat family protein n=1 Tax=uncultured delta proteobacterium TaxID=34034 RepID=A0A212JW55_9DELT|nr:PBS lyase HEAT-like repeat family protein [uncultured delta proteobacterium]
MTRFKKMKQRLEALLLPPAWPEDAKSIPEDAAAVTGMEAVSPLLALLPRGGLLKWRAVILLGRVTAALAAGSSQDSPHNSMPGSMEDARTVMRRCMWHLNEDSGNMGWGIAEAMGEIAAKSPLLAREYGRVILSYARDTGFADNFIDHAALRRGAYWAIGRFAPRYPAYRGEAAELLLAGLRDEDGQSRGIAAWGLGNLAAAGSFPDAGAREKVKAALAGVGNQDPCEVLEGLHCRVEPAVSFARQALNRLEDRGGG